MRTQGFPQTPTGLHKLEYARHLLEVVLGWPTKGNLELLADCLESISQSKKIPITQAHDYLARAVRMARDQHIEVNRFFFQNGDYMKVRPVVDVYTKEMNLRKAYEEHGCQSGWVYTKQGNVVRCPVCSGAKRASSE